MPVLKANVAARLMGPLGIAAGALVSVQFWSRYPSDIGHLLVLGGSACWLLLCWDSIRISSMELTAEGFSVRYPRRVVKWSEVGRIEFWGNVWHFYVGRKRFAAVCWAYDREALDACVMAVLTGRRAGSDG